MPVNTIKKAIAARIAMIKELYLYVTKTYRKDDLILFAWCWGLILIMCFYAYSLSRS